MFARNVAKTDHITIPKKEMTMNDLSVVPNFTNEQMNLITSTIARGASPDELKLFLYRCQSLGLDPLKPGQIYFIKYGTGPGTIVVGIEGFRARAERTGKLSGIKRGSLKDDKGNLVGAWAEVYRSDWKEPAREEVPLREFDTGKGSWSKMPETMIKKVAECSALRMAFPDALGGVYAPEEMDQANRNDNRIVAEQPTAQDGNFDETYRIPFGKFAKRTLEEVNPHDLSRYVTYLEDKAAKDEKEITGVVKDFIERAIKHIIAFDTQTSPVMTQ